MQINQKKIFEVSFPFILFFVLAIPILFRSFGSGDELWNYNFAINISKGMLPYEDFSIVQTPLSAYFSALFLLVFGNSLIVFRLAGIVLMALTFVVMFFVCYRITEQRLIAWVASIFTYVLIYPIWTYDYNQLILFAVLFIIYFEFDVSKNNNKLIALIYGFLPLIKQSTGMLLLGLFFCFLAADLIRKRQTKRSTFIRIIIALTPSGVFIVYLLVSGTFSSFMEYAVWGISTFSHRTYIWEYVFSTYAAFMVVLFIVLTIVLSSIAIVKDQKKKERRLRLLLIAIVAGAVAYPLTDHCHMMVALVPYVVCFLMCFRYKEYSRLQKTVCMAVAVSTFIVFSLGVVFEVRELQFSTLNHYEGIPMGENAEKNIALVDEYIIAKESNGKKVVIADESAAAFMIPLDKYTKNFDMLLVGNLGMNTIQDLLCNDKDVIYLVTRDDTTLGYQAHFDLIRYIKENYTKVGEVARLDAYERQN